MITTIVKLIALLWGTKIGILFSWMANRAEIAAPPKAPAKMPIRVIPICTVESKLLGELANSKATFAFLLPRLADCCKRTFRAERIAISDIANTPLATIRRKTIRISWNTDDILRSE